MSHLTAYQPGDEIVPGYRLRKRLGAGMAGQVWKAVGPGGMRVAIKIIRVEDAGGAKERRSLEVIKNVRHVHLCPIFAVWSKDIDGRLIADHAQGGGDDDSSLDHSVPPAVPEHDRPMKVDTQVFGAGRSQHPRREDSFGELVIAMQLGDCTLFDRLNDVRQQQNLPDDAAGGLEIQELMRHIGAAAEAIDWLNKYQGIIHCDIKPQNMLLVGDAVQVCDFGLAKQMQGDVTRTAHMAASAAYAPPEVLVEEHYSASGDQYCLAISYYELRTGQFPFTGTAIGKINMQKMHEEFQFDREICSDAEIGVLRRALSADPRKRFSACSEFVQALHEAHCPPEPALPATALLPTHHETTYKRDTTYLTGDEIVPGYRLLRRLGHGMSGEVWEAVGPGGLRHAIKTLDLSKLGGKKEIRALQVVKNAHHANLCPIFGIWLKSVAGELLGQSELLNVGLDDEVSSTDPVDSAIDETMDVGTLESSDEREGEVDGQLIIAMQLGDGTLHDRLKQARQEAGLDVGQPGGIAIGELLRYMRDAASAIDWLNKTKGIIHCDIKPQNILLVGGSVQVCDFGLAKKIHGDIATTQKMAASVAYAPPEVLVDNHYSASGDQYCLATSFFELRTGQFPFAGTTIGKINNQKDREDFDFDLLLPKERVVLQRAMRREPANRYGSCTEFVEALFEAHQVDLGKPPISRWTLVGGVVGFAMLVVLAVGLSLAMLRDAAQKPNITDQLVSIEASIPPPKPDETQSKALSRAYLMESLIQGIEAINAIEIPVDPPVEPATQTRLDSIRDGLLSRSLSLLDAMIDDRVLPSTDTTLADAQQIEDYHLAPTKLAQWASQPWFFEAQRARFQLQQVRQALHQFSEQETEENQQEVIDSADVLRSHLTDLDDRDSDRAAVLLAISWLSYPASDEIHLRNQVAIAEQKGLEQRRRNRPSDSPLVDDLPEWRATWESQWIAFQDRFVNVLQQQLASRHDPTLIQAIENHYPNTYAKHRAFQIVQKVKQYAIQGQWDAVASTTTATFKEHDTQMLYSELSAADRMMMHDLFDAAAQLAAAGDAIRIGVPGSLADSQKSMTSTLAALIAIDREVAQRWVKDLSFALINITKDKSLFSRVVDKYDSKAAEELSQTIADAEFDPAYFNFWCLWMAASGDEPSSDRWEFQGALKSAVGSSTAFIQQMAACVDLERRLLAGYGVDAGRAAELLDAALRGATARALPFWQSYAQYVATRFHFHQRDFLKAMASLEALPASAKNEWIKQRSQRLLDAFDAIDPKGPKSDDDISAVRFAGTDKSLRGPAWNALKHVEFLADVDRPGYEDRRFQMAVAWEIPPQPDAPPTHQLHAQSLLPEITPRLENSPQLQLSSLVLNAAIDHLDDNKNLIAGLESRFYTSSQQRSFYDNYVREIAGRLVAADRTQPLSAADYAVLRIANQIRDFQFDASVDPDLQGDFDYASHRHWRTIKDLLLTQPDISRQEKLALSIEAGKDFMIEVQHGDFYWTPDSFSKLAHYLEVAKANEVASNADLMTRLRLFEVDVRVKKLPTVAPANRKAELESILQAVDSKFWDGHQEQRTLALHYLQKADVLTHLASENRGDLEKRRALTRAGKQAIDSAAALISHVDASDQRRIYYQKGIVYEDLAFFAKLDPASHFEIAEAAYRKSKSDLPSRSLPIEDVDVGRCFYRRYEHFAARGIVDPDLIQRGIATLSLGKSKLPPVPFYDAERRLFLAKLQEAAGDLDAAVDEFEGALQVAPETNNQEARFRRQVIVHEFINFLNRRAKLLPKGEAHDLTLQRIRELLPLLNESTMLVDKLYFTSLLVFSQDATPQAKDVQSLADQLLQLPAEWIDQEIDSDQQAGEASPLLRIKDDFVRYGVGRNLLRNAWLISAATRQAAYGKCYAMVHRIEATDPNWAARIRVECIVAQLKNDDSAQTLLYQGKADSIEQALPRLIEVADRTNYNDLFLLFYAINELSRSPHELTLEQLGITKQQALEVLIKLEREPNVERRADLKQIIAYIRSL